MVRRKLIDQLSTHDVECASTNEDLHSSQLIKNIAEYFFDIRLSRYSQDYTTKVLRRNAIGLRQQANKLILFKGL